MYRNCLRRSYREILNYSYSREPFLSHQRNQQQCRYKITTSKAKSILGLVDSKPTVQQLRHAYFEAAKLCHPDVKQDDHKLDFRELTEAYDHLMNGGHISHDQYEDIPRDEEDEYRSACMEILGIRAEIVEESKQNPMFLRWLSGNTDGAQYWRNFFSANGGLSQKLRPLDGYLTSNGNTTRNASESRRRRRR
ncbi:MAG: curved DNA-binding protein CbpA [Bacillariaceae sp.]|jgi:curved DNA-binding protein CbpA